MLTKIFLFVLLFVVELSSSYAGWSGSGTILSVYSHNGFNVIMTTVDVNSCGVAGKFYWPTTDEDSNDMLSISLAALLAQKQIRVVNNEANPQCRWSGEIIT